MYSNDTNELKHFTKHCDDLIDALSKNPWQAANILWKEGFISSITMDRINIQVYTHKYKAELLFKALCDKIRRDPLDFHRLLDVLSTCGLSEALISNLRLPHTSKEIQEVDTVSSAVHVPGFQTDRKSEKVVPAIEGPSTTSVKTLLFILLVILMTLTCVSFVGVIWFGPRWPTYEITYIIQIYLLKIGVPLPAILVTMSVFVTLMIGISTYLCFGNL